MFLHDLIQACILGSNTEVRCSSQCIVSEVHDVSLLVMLTFITWLRYLLGFFILIHMLFKLITETVIILRKLQHKANNLPKVILISQDPIPVTLAQSKHFQLPHWGEFVEAGRFD